MVFTYGTTDIKIENFSDYESLEAALEQCADGSIFAGQKQGAENYWNMLAVSNRDTGEYFGIGLLTASSQSPHFLLLDNNLLFLGGDSFSVAFDLQQKQVKTLMPLPGEFVDFLHFPDRRIIIIVHKKGVIAKTEACEELWRCSSGILSSYSVDKNVLILDKSDGERMICKIKNGKSVKPKQDLKA